MSITPGQIDFDHLGIGKALATNLLRVPEHQREYSWEDEHVKDLFEDFQRAVNQGAYFLGTIVLTRSPTGRLEVTDGQQRLATVTILLAAIRNYFIEREDKFRVEYIENTFLTDIDPRAQRRVSRLTLNVDDNQFFHDCVLSVPGTGGRDEKSPRESHRRIRHARDLAEKRVETIIQGHGEQAKTEVLLHWIDFIKDKAQIILLTVPSHLNAYRMFETLNDRGLKTSQSDLLKNYLFGESGDRLPEAQHKWSAMAATLESVGVDDIVLTYLRHLLVAKHGATRGPDVYDKIKSTVSGAYPAIEFLADLEENATTYTALLNYRHPHWDNYGNFTPKIRRHVETLNELRMEQIRPLMLACMKMFPPKEVERSFRAFISWAVRFMIGGQPTGNIEKYYAGRASEVWKGEIKDADALATAMLKYMPDDETFRSAFASARVSKSYIARYLLRSLELKVKDDPQPERVVNDDPTVLTLEHVLPENPSADWGIDADTAQTLYRRLGNMVLLRASPNSTIGNATFEEKRKVYKESSALVLTKNVLKYKAWGRDEINKRQAWLADYAVETWPLKLR